MIITNPVSPIGINIDMATMIKQVPGKKLSVAGYNPLKTKDAIIVVIPSIIDIIDNNLPETDKKYFDLRNGTILTLINIVNKMTTTSS